MAECIEREATIKRIKEVYCVGCNSYNGVRCRACGIGDAIDIIEDAPTVDAVIVTRCKDCKHFKNYGKTSLLIDGKNIKAGWCHRRARYDEEYRMPPDGFCSYGERKGGGNADENRDPEN